MMKHHKEKHLNPTNFVKFKQTDKKLTVHMLEGYINEVSKKIKLAPNCIFGHYKPDR